MGKPVDLGKPTRVTRDGGYSKLKSISSRNRYKSINVVENSSKYKLKEIFAEIDIVVNPEAMTYLFSNKNK